MVGRRRGFSDRWAVGLGVLIGALVLTKLTVYVFVPLILGTLLRPLPPHPPFPASERGGRLLRMLRWPLIACLTAAVVCGWWLIRNMLVYGPLDPLAMARHDEIVVGQPRWTTYDLEALEFFFRILFRSFWGMFGWMGVVLDDGFYILYLVLTVLGVAGVLVGRRLWPKSNDGHASGGRASGPPLLPHSHERQRRTGGEGIRLRHADLLGWAALLVFAEVAYYNLTFIQPQGRYLFPALVPIALFLAHGWWRLAFGALRGAVGRLLTAGVLAGAVAWGLGEAHGALRAAELWSDNALIVAALVGTLAVLLAPFAAPDRVRRWLPDALCLLLAVTLALLDLAALLKFVAPAFPAR